MDQNAHPGDPDLDDGDDWDEMGVEDEGEAGDDGQWERDELVVEEEDDDDDDGEWEDEWEDDEDEDEDDEWEEDELEDETFDDEWDEEGDFAPVEVGRTLSFGLLAMAPLFVLYELGAASLAAAGDPRRSLAEVVLTVPLRPLAGSASDLSGARQGAALLTLLLALFISARRHWPIGGKLLRVVLEGAVGAVLLAPILGWVAAQTAPLGGGSPLTAGGPPGSFGEIAAAMGGAAYEELVFRIGALSLIYAVTHRLLERFGWPEGFARVSAACAGATLSALFFAAVHLEAFVALLGGAVGHGGEAFDGAVFAWRTAAGLLLGCMVVWRGVGVAAWAHAFFNLAILLRLH